MEKGIQKPCTLPKIETKKEVNSWDCSTPTSNGETSKRKPNDWDSGSECQETMVEPFQNDENINDHNDWDSESEKAPSKNHSEEKKSPKTFVPGSEDSYEISLGALSSMKSTGTDVTNDESLLVEDFDEFIDVEKTKNEEDSSKIIRTADTENEKVQTKSEGTPEDTTIWMIPKSDRTQSRESSSNLISSSNRNLHTFKYILTKAKSLSDVHKIKTKRRTIKSSRSVCLKPEKNNSEYFLLLERRNLKRNLEIETEKTKANIPGCGSFDRNPVFFTEFECRTMTVDLNVPEKLSPSLDNNGEEVIVDSNESVPENPPEVASDAVMAEIDRAGPSGAASMDAMSLPDMSGKKWMQKRKNENPFVSNNMVYSPSEPGKGNSGPISESWLLYDKGQYRTISRNVVSLLLNGRSAEAVLQGRKEHFIPNATLTDSDCLKDSLTSMMVNNSTSDLKRDDLGGEDDRKKVIDLERKVENTLIYIQPGMNQTASVRIIPMDREMIHVWRTTRDGGSVLSLEDVLANPSQDSMELASNFPPETNSSIIRRPFTEETVSEEDENEAQDSVKRHKVPVLSGLPETEVAKYTKLLFETRVIVDSLTNSFNVLQNRLEGEKNRNVTLQGEVHQLRLLMRNCAGKYYDGSIKDGELQSIQSSLVASSCVLKDPQSEIITEEKFDDNFLSDNYSKITLEVQDKSTSVDLKEGTETPSVNEQVITLNIYTMEKSGPGENTDVEQSSIETNLKVIADRMKRLQQENEFLLNQNGELKRKLKEISMELEKYLSGSSDCEPCGEDGKEQETSRDQVCNLKLEPENLKIALRDPKKHLPEETPPIREEFEKSIISLNNWCTIAKEIFEKIEKAKIDLLENEIELETQTEADAVQNPTNFSSFLSSYIEETSRGLVKIKNENFLLEQTLEELKKESNASKEMSGLDEVISGYSELIEQCRKGQMTSEMESKVMEDYFTVIMEKASLIDEIKMLKTENEMLLEGQMDHYEKLKQTMIALKDRKSEVTALESSQKLLEEEKSTMEEVLKLCEDEKKALKEEMMKKNKTIEDLMEEMKKKDSELAYCSERLNAAMNEITNFEKSCVLKDELISKVQLDYDELLAAVGVKDNQIEILQDEMRNLEMRGAQLEAELTSSKLFLNESQKEMTDYIKHLEALASTSQDSLDKAKQKIKESNQIINRMKNENDILDQQHQCDVKLFNNTKDELNSCKEKLTKVENKLKESEEEREKLVKHFEGLAGSEKEKSAALESLSREYKSIIEENTELTEKVEIYSKDKDELLKEQKELINKYGVLSREIQKLQDKYRSVKSECNERTDLIKYLEMMLKENLVEYNNRIACLEQSISRIIEKIAVCKNGIREKYFVDAEVRELRQQLDVTYRERKEMEQAVSTYYSLTKHLEQEIQERERKFDELHAKLSLEHRKTEEDNGKKSAVVLESPSITDRLKVQQLERQVQVTEQELLESKKELQRCQTNFENEKKKLELTIADMKSEIKRYQLRIEVMMRNFSNCNKTMNGLSPEKRNTEEHELLKKDLREKDKTISELKVTLNKYKAEIELKNTDLENSKKRNFFQDEELKNLKNEVSKMRDAATTASKTTETQQKERDEMAEKLFQSIKLIMEERSARQAIESLVMEKEKNFKNQIEEMKNEMTLKTKEIEAVTEALEEKKKLVCKLQDDVKKLKADISSFKGQTHDHRKRSNHKGSGDDTMWGEQYPLTSTPLKSQNVSSERLESCLKELKEIREVNLQLRQTEGQYQAKIVRLEDEIRDARLLIKELQGDIKTEKKSKKAFKNMIMAAKTEIEKCVLANQLMTVIADRISRHLDLSEIPSREFLSGFRLSDASSSSKCVLE